MPIRLPEFTRPLPARTWLTWRPGLDTWIAAGSVVAMWLVYLGQGALAGVSAPAGTALFVVLGVLVLATLLPVWVVWHLMRRDLDDVGMSTRRMWLAVLVSVLVGLATLPAFWQSAAGMGMDPINQTWGSLLMLWEPFFVCGWLHLRFRDAFGELPAPILAGFGYGLFHLGSVPFADVVFYVVFGTVMAALFALTRNLFTMMPITWALAGGLASIAAGVRYDINAIALFALVVAAQVAIVVVVYRRHPGDPSTRIVVPDDRGAAELRVRAERDRRRRDRAGER